MLSFIHSYFFFLVLNKLELRVPYRNIPNFRHFYDFGVNFQRKTIFSFRGSKHGSGLSLAIKTIKTKGFFFQGLKTWERLGLAIKTIKTKVFVARPSILKKKPCCPKLGLRDLILYTTYIFFRPEIAPAGLISDSFRV
jgi:hypothetical protein